METEKKEKSLIARIMLCIMTVIASIAALIIGGSVLGEALLSPMLNSSDSTLVFLGNYASFIGIWIVFLLISLIGKDNRKEIAALKFKKERVKTSLVLGLCCGLCLNLFVGIVAAIHGDIQLSFNTIDIPMILLFLVCVAIQSGAEELAMRWFVFRHLRRYFPNIPAIAIIVNSMLFAALHLMNPGITIFSLLSVGLSGLVFSLIVYYFDSFWGAVIAHTGWNYCQSILLGLPNSGVVSEYSVFKLDAANARDSFAYSASFGIEGSLLTVILLTLTCAVLIYLGRKKARRFNRIA